VVELGKQEFNVRGIIPIWILALAPLSSASAQTNYSPLTGKIAELSQAENGNAGFRVFLQGSPEFCATNLYGYVNAADDNSSLKISMLMSAFLSGKTVKLWFSNQTINSIVRCRIDLVSIYN
jgi:hypothetical protein